MNSKESINRIEPRKIYSTQEEVDNHIARMRAYLDDSWDEEKFKADLEKMKKDREIGTQNPSP